MSYQSMFDEAKEAGRAKGLSAKYVEFKKKGDAIIGRLVSRNKVASTAGTGYYYQYLFETDKGLIKCALGTATDNEAGALMGKDGVYSITFMGKQDIGHGRSINRFDILEIAQPVEAVVGGAGDVPF